MTDPGMTQERAVPAARVALVTGAGQGIGRQVALGLARAGLAIGVLGRRRRTLEAVAGEIAGQGGSVAMAVADVRDVDQLREAVRQVQDGLGGIDLLVNNAGTIDPVEEPIWQADPGAWWDVVETDLRGPFHGVRAVVPGMLERGGGRIVGINSGLGVRDTDLYSAYSVAKAGMFRIAGAVHTAGYHRGLRAFEIAPGVLRTSMTEAMPAHAGRRSWTDPQRLLDLLVAVAQGRLDTWSGCYLRADVDTVDSLIAAAPPDGQARRLRIRPYGSQDPLG
jgi:NAD(P)-dependent dehydrogenase (short-subunit alcohol dehydrogenase family)